MSLLKSRDLYKTMSCAGSERELRVDVFVDTITRLSIKTTSLELLLEETPSTFAVVAYDEDGEFCYFVWK